MRAFTSLLVHFITFIRDRVTRVIIWRNQCSLFALYESMRFERQQSIFSHRYERLVHIIGWAGYLTVFGLLWAWGGVQQDLRNIINFFLTVLIYLPGGFYLITFYLIPNYLQKKRWGQFFKWMGMLLLGLVLVNSLVDVILLATFWPSVNAFLWEMGERLVVAFASLAFLTACAFVYRFIVDGVDNAYQIEKLTAEKNAAELAFLKSQVDPHFLFNTLNSLYALALSEHGNATADGIAKLGTLMRYNLHDARESKISLAREVNYIQEYVALQQLRTSQDNKVELCINIPEDQLQAWHIAPMLLIPFVENAFKFGIHPAEPASIRIIMSHHQQVFSLEIENSLPRQQMDAPSGGIGLKNVKERLTRLYPGRHALAVDATPDRYRVKLEVHLT